jgi:hypothetical protein
VRVAVTAMLTTLGLARAVEALQTASPTLTKFLRAAADAVEGDQGVSSAWVTLRARWVTLRARWVTLRARWVTLRARWVTLRARWVTL